MPTISIYLRTFSEALTVTYDLPEARALARRVVASRLGWAPHELAMRGSEAVPESRLALFTDDLRRLLAHEPIQYVLGTAPFLELELEVGPGVLIPRPETEELVQLVIADYKTAHAPRLLDAGTGSGCLAVALAHYLPTAVVTGLDVSADALAIARRNGARYGDSVRWEQADIFEALPAALTELDGIVSNPPYVPQRESAGMAAHVRDHEPALALFVPDDDALRYYRRLAEIGHLGLRPGGRVYLETHIDYATAVADLFAAAGYVMTRVHPDFTGRPRFVTATKSA
jgi:release factor glutamine methyltransferase